MRGRFLISFEFVNYEMDYEKFCELSNEMNAPINRLKDIGWIFSDYETSTINTEKNGIYFRKVEYLFKIPDVDLGTNEIPTVKKITDVINRIVNGIEIEDIDIIESQDDAFEYDVRVEFSSSFYDGNPDVDALDNDFKSAANLMGADSYHYEKGSWRVNFYFSTN